MSKRGMRNKAPLPSHQYENEPWTAAIRISATPMKTISCLFAFHLSGPRRLALLGTLMATTAACLSAAPVRKASARNVVRNYAAEPMAASELRPVERDFLMKAVEMTRQQMRLAEIGASQAESAEVRSHALQLTTDYRSLSDALDALIRRKGGIPGAPVGGTSETYQVLAQRNGADFDREFVRVVAQTNDLATMLFEQAASEAKDADVREFAATELPTLRGHRNASRDLRKNMP